MEIKRRRTRSSVRVQCPIFS